MLRQRLLEALRGPMDRGEILRTDGQARGEGDRLRLTLLAECRAQIGRMQDISPPEAPGTGEQDTQQEERDP